MLKETRDGMITVLPPGWQDCVTQLRHSPPPSWLPGWGVTQRETRLVDEMIDCVNKKFDMFDWVHPFWWENTNRLGTSLLSLSKSRAISNCFWLKPFQALRQRTEAILRTHGGKLILHTLGSGEIRYVNNTHCRWLNCIVKPVSNHSNVFSVDIQCGHVHDQCWGWLTAAGKLRTEKERKLAILKSSPASPAQPRLPRLRCPNLMRRSDCYGRVQPRNIAPLGNLWNTETMEVVLQSHLGCGYCTYRGMSR